MVLAVTIAAGYYLASGKTVTLTVDGAAQSVDTRATTVGDILAEQEITWSPDDVITPAVDAELPDGGTIEILRARPLVVVIDGSETTHTVTDLVLGDALATVGAPIDGAELSVPLNQSLPLTGTTVNIVTPKQVTLDLGGQVSTTVSTAGTVDELLAAEQVPLGDLDRVVPVGSTAVTDGMTVVVTRLRVENEVRVEPIAHDTIERNDSNMLVGTRKVTTEGRDGERELTVALSFSNGEVVGEEQINSVVTREPVTEVVSVGTKPKPTTTTITTTTTAVVAETSDAAAAGSSTTSAATAESTDADSTETSAGDADGAGGEAAGLNWAALAECESSGNPKAVNPAGYYGLYQFSLRTWASVGGTGNPVDASPAEQLKRAQILYNSYGAGQWPTCGPNLFK